MPEPISRGQADFALGRMEYQIIDEVHGLVKYLDPRYPGNPERPLYFDFIDGSIPWDDFRKHLEYEGVNVAAFLAELEAM